MKYILHTSDDMTYEFDNLPEAIDILSNILEFERVFLSTDFNCYVDITENKSYIWGRERSEFMLYDRILFSAYITENDEYNNTIQENNFYPSFDERCVDKPRLLDINSNCADKLNYTKLDERFYENEWPG
jgi:hypothetical protein